MSDTPETDAATIESGGNWSFELRETCRRLEREMAEAQDALEFRRELYKVQESYLATARRERDEASDMVEKLTEQGLDLMDANRTLKRERDEARNQRDILRLDAQREAEQHDRMVGELEKGYRERDEAREEAGDLKVRYRSAMMDRDSYRFQAEQKYAMRRELEELLGIESGEAGDEQFKKGFNNLKAMIRERDEWAAMCGRYKQERDEAREEIRKLKIILDIIKNDQLKS